MTRRARFVVALLGIGLVLGGLYWFLQNFEWAEREVRTAISSEARRNPLLAAERFLDRLGVTANSVSGRDWLLDPPPERGVLIVHYLGPSLPEQREQRLLRWVEEGGHLIVTADREWDEDAEGSGNHLLDSLGVRFESGPAEQDQEPESEAAGSADPPDLDTSAASEPGAADAGAEDEGECVLPIDYPGYPYPLEVALGGPRHLYDAAQAAHWWVEGELGDQLLQYRLGDGRITVLSDNGFLTNDEIGEHDHALFLALLVGDERRAWLLYSSDMPSLATLLWQRAPYLVVSVLVLCGLWLWRLARRTGPLLVQDSVARRNLMEHLEAAAGYAWRVDRAQAMLRATREGLDKAWRRRYPALARADRQVRCEMIGERTGLAPRAVEQALYGDVEGEQQFITTSAIQQKLAAGLSRTGAETQREPQ